MDYDKGEQRLNESSCRVLDISPYLQVGGVHEQVELFGQAPPRGAQRNTGRRLMLAFDHERRLEMEGKVMLKFELPTEKLRELEGLMEAAGIGSKKDLMNIALTLLEWAIKEKEGGRIIASVDEENRKYKELLMPVFSRQETRSNTG